MKHPFQQVLLNKSGDLLFASSINSIFVFKLTENDVKLAGTWTDELDPNYTLLKQHQAKLKALEEEEARRLADGEPAAKIQKTNDKKKLPKLPKAGPGAPPTFTYIRDMKLTRNEQYLIVTTDNDKAVVSFKLDESKDNILNFIKRQPFPKRPSSITTSVDDTKIIISDKFGDVYEIDLLDTKVIEEKDLEPILGHVSMLTSIDNVNDKNGKEYVITSDRDEHIRITNYPTTYVIKKWLFGHEEFLSSFVLPTWLNNEIIVSGGGDDFICSWNWQQDGNELIQKADLKELIQPYLTDKHLAPVKFQNETNDLLEFCVSQIVPVHKLQKIIVIIENTPVFFVFDISSNGELSFDKKIETKANIVSVASSDNKLIVSIDDNEHQLEVYTLNNDISKVQDESKLVSKITSLNGSNVASIDEVVPLFTVAQLRKRSEH